MKRMQCATTKKVSLAKKHDSRTIFISTDFDNSKSYVNGQQHSVPFARIDLNVEYL